MLRYSTFCNSLKIIVVNLLKLLVDIPYYIYLFLSSLLISLWQKLRRKRKSLDNETILVTGAASGLGQQIVLKLAKISRNAVFILWDINAKGLAETAGQCREIGATNVYAHVVDLSNYEDVIRTANRVRSEIGTVTMLINNAGLSPYKLFLDSDPTTEETVIRVNLLSQMWTIREFLPAMIQNRRGHLISTCSGIAFHRFPYLTSYAASKHGLKGFLESLKVEIDKHVDKPKIKMSIIYPGWVKTEMTSGIEWTSRYEGVDVLDRIEPDKAVERMVDGILREKEEIVVPYEAKHMLLLNGYFSTRFVNRLENYLFRNIRIKTAQKDEAFVV